MQRSYNVSHSLVDQLSCKIAIGFKNGIFQMGAVIGSSLILFSTAELVSKVFFAKPQNCKAAESQDQ